jgi:hypothetical protein
MGDLPVKNDGLMNPACVMPVEPTKPDTPTASKAARAPVCDYEQMCVAELKLKDWQPLAQEACKLISSTKEEAAACLQKRVDESRRQIKMCVAGKQRAEAKRKQYQPKIDAAVRRVTQPGSRYMKVVQTGLCNGASGPGTLKYCSAEAAIIQPVVEREMQKCLRSAIPNVEAKAEACAVYALNASIKVLYAVGVFLWSGSSEKIDEACRKDSNKHLEICQVNKVWQSYAKQKGEKASKAWNNYHRKLAGLDALIARERKTRAATDPAIQKLAAMRVALEKKKPAKPTTSNVDPISRYKGVLERMRALMQSITQQGGV